MKTSSQKTCLTGRDLEIRVFEAVCLNERPMPAIPRIPAATLFPVMEQVFARILEPITAVLYAPRAPSVHRSFSADLSPMPHFGGMGFSSPPQI